MLCDACIQPWSVPPPLVASGLRKASRYFCVIFASIRVRTALHRAILRLGPRFRRILETTLRWLRNPPLRYPYLPIEAPNSSASAFIPIQRRRVGQLCFSRFRGLSSSEKERSGTRPTTPANEPEQAAETSRHCRGQQLRNRHRARHLSLSMFWAIILLETPPRPAEPSLIHGGEA